MPKHVVVRYLEQAGRSGTHGAAVHAACAMHLVASSASDAHDASRSPAAVCNTVHAQV